MFFATIMPFSQVMLARSRGCTGALACALNPLCSPALTITPRDECTGSISTAPCTTATRVPGSSTRTLNRVPSAVAGLDDKRPIGRRKLAGGGNQYLAAQQFDPSLAGAESDVQRAVGVDQQARAVGQGQVLLLADRGVLIGHPLLPRQLPLRQPDR